MSMAVGKDVEKLIDALGNDEIPPGHLFQMYYGGWWTWEEDAKSRKIKAYADFNSHKLTIDERDTLIQACDSLLAALGNQVDPGEALQVYRQEFHVDGFAYKDTFVEAESASREKIAKINCLLLDTRTIDGRTLDLLRQLIARQKLVAPTDKSWIRMVTLSAPLVTGIGREHPTENGFAFLDPYGLPYYSGSGVKGALRRAAEELALFEEDRGGWTLPAVWWLFGFDGDAGYFGEDREWREAAENHAKSIDADDKDSADATRKYFRLSLGAKEYTKEFGPTPSCLSIIQKMIENRKLRRSVHMRGVLDFWDVFPEPSGGRIRIDVLNPHDKEYYKNGTSPGTFREPDPHYFLTVPVESKLLFIAVLNDRLKVPDSVAVSWKDLLDKALGYLGTRAGIGAKTSVGYGRFSVDPAEGGSGADKVVWENASLDWKANEGHFVATQNGKSTAPSTQDLIEKIPEATLKKLKKTKKITARRVTVSIDGNLIKIEKLEF